MTYMYVNFVFFLCLFFLLHVSILDIYSTTLIVKAVSLIYSPDP